MKESAVCRVSWAAFVPTPVKRPVGGVKVDDPVAIRNLKRLAADRLRSPRNIRIDCLPPSK